MVTVKDRLELTQVQQRSVPVTPRRAVSPRRRSGFFLVSREMLVSVSHIPVPDRRPQERQFGYTPDGLRSLASCSMGHSRTRFCDRHREMQKSRPSHPAQQSGQLHLDQGERKCQPTRRRVAGRSYSRGSRFDRSIGRVACTLHQLDPAVQSGKLGRRARGPQ